MRLPRLLHAFVLIVALAAAPATLGAQRLDLLITGGRVVDGTGAPWFRADVGIRDGRIVEIGSLAGREAARTIDAADRVVAPGFIDLMGVSSFPLIADPASAESKLRQGITTMMVGEGGSHAPQNERTLGTVEVGGKRLAWRTFDEYFRLLEAARPALNVVHNVGLAQIRQVVLGDEDVEPTPAQLEEMKGLVRQAMEQGAVGVSTALIYPPGTYASTEELVELARAAAPYGGVYFTHMRNESGAVLEAIDEAILVGERAGIPTHIYHLKAAGEENWPLMDRALERIAAARARGLDVTADVYPYIRNGLGIEALVHPRHFAEGDEAFRRTLSDPAVRRALRAEIEGDGDWENWYRHVGQDWDKVLIVEAGPANRDLVGLSVQGAAEKRGADPWELFFDLVQAGGVGVTPESMNEAQKHAALRAPFVGLDTDAPPTNPATAASSHPRAFGAFPRLLAKYVREEKVIPLEEAVQKMTSFSANRLGLHDRGRIAPGMMADLVIFDPARIQDRATYTEPLRFAEGIDYEIVNGVLTIAEGKLTGERPGRVLRR